MSALFKLIRDLLRFLFPRQRFYLNHGGRIISPYTLVGAKPEEKILILAGVARSPADARALFLKHKTRRPEIILATIARTRRRQGLKDRIKLLIQRIDGHDPRNPWGNPNAPEPIRVEYRYRARK